MSHGISARRTTPLRTATDFDAKNTQGMNAPPLMSHETRADLYQKEMEFINCFMCEDECEMIRCRGIGANECREGPSRILAYTVRFSPISIWISREHANESLSVVSFFFW
jgi:hypothetical protein